MKLDRRINSTLLSFTLAAGLLGGMLVGQFFTARTMQVAEAASQEHQLAAMQAARGAMNLIKYDMERSGYAEASPLSHSAFRVTTAHPGDALQLTRVTPQSIEFRSLDGRDIVEYRLEGTRLSRIASGRESERVLLLANAQSFSANETPDAATVNVSFATPVGGAGAPVSVAPVMAHFVRSSQ